MHLHVVCEEHVDLVALKVLHQALLLLLNKVRGCLDQGDLHVFEVSSELAQRL